MRSHVPKQKNRPWRRTKSAENPLVTNWQAGVRPRPALSRTDVSETLRRFVGFGPNSRLCVIRACNAQVLLGMMLPIRRQAVESYMKTAN